MQNNKIKILISDQPDSKLISQEYITKTAHRKFNADIKKLIESNTANFHGRAWNKVNGAVYQIFTLENKRILVEDAEATVMIKSMFDTDGRLRELALK